eukprot:11197231-Ditylum_brightwellii.AAC.1
MSQIVIVQVQWSVALPDSEYSHKCMAKKSAPIRRIAWARHRDVFLGIPPNLLHQGEFKSPSGCF